ACNAPGPAFVRAPPLCAPSDHGPQGLHGFGECSFSKLVLAGKGRCNLGERCRTTSPNFCAYPFSVAVASSAQKRVQTSWAAEELAAAPIEQQLRILWPPIFLIDALSVLMLVVLVVAVTYTMGSVVLVTATSREARPRKVSHDTYLRRGEHEDCRGKHEARRYAAGYLGPQGQAEYFHRCRHDLSCIGGGGKSGRSNLWQPRAGEGDG
ncbi:unnamed protein product, partial [Phaeothamnion confervicola]